MVGIYYNVWYCESMYINKKMFLDIIKGKECYIKLIDCMYVVFF